MNRETRRQPISTNFETRPRAGVDAIVVVQAAHDIDETRFILDLAEQHDFIAGIVGWVDAKSPTAGDDVLALAGNSRLKGLRPVIGDNQSIGWMTDRDIAPLFRAMADSSLSFDILIQNPDDLAAIHTGGSP